MQNHRLPDHLIQNHEQHFRDIFSKLNKLIPATTLISAATIMIALWGILFGLLYADISDVKKQAAKDRIEVVRELGEIKTLIAGLKNPKQNLN